MTVNMAASVHQRLLNRARETGRPFNELLQYFALERYLYRLGKSPFANHFVLKGALMLAVWQGYYVRSTRDIDLLGHMENTTARLIEVMRAICLEPVAMDDGLRFEADKIHAEHITEAADYKGVRVVTPVALGTARMQVRIDVGFGDVLVPGPKRVRLPTILDFPVPELQGYSRESVVAEKFQAMVYLGEINSRMKDFFDLWLLATRTDFDGSVLAKAIKATFRQRRTTLPVSPVALSPDFGADRDKQAQWAAFYNRHHEVTSPARLETVIADLAAFLLPVVVALRNTESFEQHWIAGGPWRPGPLPEDDAIKNAPTS